MEFESFSIYKEEESMLDLMEQLGNKQNEVVETIDKKLTDNGNSINEVIKAHDKKIGDIVDTIPDIIKEEVNKFDGDTATIKGRFDEIDSSLAEKAKQSDLVATNVNVTNLENIKATKTEVDVERKRIDTFTSLASGSTTGDAELIDGRVGADGIIYANIGTANRKQFAKLNESVFTQTKLLTSISWVLKHIDVTGILVPNSNKNVVTENMHLLKKGTTISCNTGYKFQIALYNVTTGNFISRILWMTSAAKYILDNDYNVRIEISDTNESVQSNTSISSNINVMYNSDNIASNALNIQTIKNDIITISNTTNKLDLKEIAMTNNFYIPIGNIGIGNVVSTTPVALADYRYAIIDCSINKNFTISGTGGNNPRLWGFLDSNNILISCSDALKTETSLKLIAPSNATKLIINDLKTGKISYQGLDVITKIQEIDQSIINTNNNIEYISIDKANEGIDQISNIVDVLGIDFFKGKTTTVTMPNKYSAWSFVGVTNGKLVCVYSRGLGHEDNATPSIYVKTSKNGVVWSIERKVIDTPNIRDTITGKGNDTNGNMLMWVRKGSPGGSTTKHDLYKTSDGITFIQISSPIFTIVPSHIGDIFYVPSVGLMAFYNTVGAGTHSWGLVISADNGVTWTQRKIEDNLQASECPMEISCVRLNDGKLLAIGRNEARSNDGILAQYQMQSTDNGSTWTKLRTNITDIALSTPSLIYNSITDEISNYYFQRDVGALKLRKSKVVDVWDKPSNWSTSQIIANGTTNFQDTGNVNAVAYRDNHIATYYSGDSINTGIYATII